MQKLVQIFCGTVVMTSRFVLVARFGPTWHNFVGIPVLALSHVCCKIWWLKTERCPDLTFRQTSRLFQAQFLGKENSGKKGKIWMRSISTTFQLGAPASQASHPMQLDSKAFGSWVLQEQHLKKPVTTKKQLIHRSIHSFFLSSIPFHSIPFRSVRFYSILFYSILFYSLPSFIHSIPSHSIPFHSRKNMYHCFSILMKDLDAHSDESHVQDIDRTRAHTPLHHKANTSISWLSSSTVPFDGSFEAETSTVTKHRRSPRRGQRGGWRNRRDVMCPVCHQVTAGIRRRKPSSPWGSFKNWGVECWVVQMYKSFQIDPTKKRCWEFESKFVFLNLKRGSILGLCPPESTAETRVLHSCLSQWPENGKIEISPVSWKSPSQNPHK